MLAAGDTIADFTLDTLEGGTHTLKDMLHGGPLLLVLFKVSCPVCQLALPYLDRLGGGKLNVVGISQDYERPTEQFLRTFGVKMPMLLDRDEDGYPVSNMFGIDHVPSMFVVERDGVISAASSGFVKAEMEALGERAGVEIFHADDSVPAWKAG
jgi:peroxiredoxin